MKIGIIVHSNTGNTYSVAQMIKVEYEKNGHQVALEKVTAANEDQQEVEKIQLLNKPDINEYDFLVFGASVRGFSLSPVMTAYLKQLSNVQGKKAACFLTQFFPHPAMGGNRAMGQMKGLCTSRGMLVYETGIINWSNINRSKKIQDVAESFGRIVGNSFTGGRI